MTIIKELLQLLSLAHSEEQQNAITDHSQIFDGTLNAHAANRMPR